MTGSKSVFIIGPGFIGLNVLDLLVGENYRVTALTRRDEQAAQLAKSGVSTVKGGLHDHDLIAEQTHKHDIVIHMATADDVPSVVAVLDGVKKRAAESKPVIYIHTSGTSVLDDGANGAHHTDKIYSDETREGIDSLEDDAPHRQIDLTIVRAQKELGDRAKLAIIIPPLIYGFNPTHERLTIQIPTLTRWALKHGYAGHVGKGLSAESQVHVLDLARAYIMLLHHIEQSSPSVLLENPYFFCEDGKEFTWKEVAENIGKELHRAGRIKDPQPKTIPEELYNEIFGEFTGAVAGLNSRSRAVRLRKLGWQPREKGLWESFRDDELPALLKEDCSEFSGYKGAVAS